MKIAKIQTARISIALKTPFKTALRTVNSLCDVVVKVTADDGTYGFGEAPPTAAITGETLESIEAAIACHLAPSVAGFDPLDADGIFDRLNGCIIGNTSAKAAVDIAVHDLRARILNVPLYAAIGGGRRELESDLTLSLNAPEIMAADAVKALSAGFRILKIKVGGDPKIDVSRVRAVREAVGGGVTLRVDANQGWDAKTAVRAVSAMEDAGCCIELVEQPVPARDIDGLRYVTQSVATPVLADESVFSCADAVKIITTKAADLINIKLMKAGGITGALRIAAVAGEFGVGCMAGCMLESKISVAAAVHFASARAAVTMCDLDGVSLCASDPYTGGPEFDGAKILPNESAGLGITGVPCFD